VIVDSSAVLAITLGEADAEVFAEALLSDRASMSVANWLECTMVADNRGSDVRANFEQTLVAAGVELVPVTLAQAHVAREAHRRFGRGSGSPAKLNYGDCFAYALAITTGDALLFKGDDFTHTDVRPAWAPES